MWTTGAGVAAVVSSELGELGAATPSGGTQVTSDGPLCQPGVMHPSVRNH
jgi:hypothetical protein